MKGIHSIRDKTVALDLLQDKELYPTEKLLEQAAVLRQKYFGKRVQIHIINNVRNGYCQEDCNYCAQRREAPSQGLGGTSIISKYADKSDDEILAEARSACEKGAYRYCLVSAGRGPGKKMTERYAHLIRKIKHSYPLEVCLSAGLLHDAQDATVLAEAGLDRYNHNLNTSREFYSKICSTHTYQDRLDTLACMQKAGVALCSGLIVGMGESLSDIVEVAWELEKQGVASIPVNFFLPVQKDAIPKNPPFVLDTDMCLRILCLLRLLNLKSEIRLAAGREYYLAQKEWQVEALRVANSLFLSGYLNVQGNTISSDIAMLQSAGYEIEMLGQNVANINIQARQEVSHKLTKPLPIKGVAELRPFQKHNL